MDHAIEDVKDILRDHYPHGHPDYIDITLKELELHSKKNYDYTFGGDPLGNFNRVSTILSLYKGLDLGDPAVVALIYMMKQLDAVLWMLANGYEGGVEGLSSRFADIYVYSKIARIIKEEQKSAVHKEGKKN